MNLEEMLKNESFKFNAYADNKEAAKEALLKLNSETRKCYNVYALEFEKVIDEARMFKISDYLKEKVNFGFIVGEVFKGIIRDSKCNTEQFYHKYYQTIIPGVISGNYNIFYADYKGLIVSFAIITKTEEGAFVENIWSDINYGEIYLDVLNLSLSFIDKTKPVKCDKKSPYVDVIREFYKNK